MILLIIIKISSFTQQNAYWTLHNMNMINLLKALSAKISHNGKLYLKESLLKKLL